MVAHEPHKLKGRFDSAATHQKWGINIPMNQQEIRQLLKDIVLNNRGIKTLEWTGLDAEASLGIFFRSTGELPHVDETSSDDELFSWGAKFKSLVATKISETEAEMIRAGELSNS